MYKDDAIIKKMITEYIEVIEKISSMDIRDYAETVMSSDIEAEWIEFFRLVTITSEYSDQILNRLAFVDHHKVV